MLKPLTLSLSLAVALGFCSVSMAGGHDSGCSTCGLASPQGGPIASAQAPCDNGCGGGCGGGFHMPKCHLFSNWRPLQWPALQAEELCHPTRLLRVGPEEEAALGSPRRRLRRRRLWRCSGLRDRPGCSSGQGGYAAPSGQGGYAAPQAAPIYGAGQHAFKAVKPATTIASVPAEMTPAIAGEEAPPAPEVKETTQSGLLLPTPSGN